jgi:methenyltetrahydrofolate cyclohydrolase
MADNSAVADLLDSPLGDFLDTLAGEGPAPGGGSAAAIVVAMSAGLVAMVARASEGHWDEAGGVIGQAQTFRARVAPLAQADADAYQEALNALRKRDELEERYRDQQLRAALDRSADIPLQIAETGCDLASLAALLVERGNPEVRADAAAAAVLAESGTRVAAKLVAINLGAAPDDERVRRAGALVEQAAEAARRALAAAE